MDVRGTKEARSLQHKDKVLRNMRKIEGQVRGVQRMIEEERYCLEILAQLASIKAATNSIGLALLENHTRGCVLKAIQEHTERGEAHIGELMEAIRAFTK